MAQSGFYSADMLERAAINLFYGWGYNFYRKENQLRADDLLIRSKVGWLLGSARKSVAEAESAYRREFLPPPSRESPRHDAKAVEGAQTIERLSRAIGVLEGRMTAQPVPENDRMTQRYREEASALLQLLECDTHLVGQADLLRSMVDQKNGAWLVENAAAVQEGIAAIDESLRKRQGLLFPTS